MRAIKEDIATDKQYIELNEVENTNNEGVIE